MAKARYTPENNSEIPGVTLELTGEEALVVLSVLGKVSGEFSPIRAATDRIYEALSSIIELRSAKRWITSPGTFAFTGEKR